MHYEQHVQSAQPAPRTIVLLCSSAPPCIFVLSAKVHFALKFKVHQQVNFCTCSKSAPACLLAAGRYYFVTSQQQLACPDCDPRPTSAQPPSNRQPARLVPSSTLAGVRGRTHLWPFEWCWSFPMAQMEQRSCGHVCRTRPSSRSLPSCRGTPGSFVCTAEVGAVASPL